MTAEIIAFPGETKNDIPPAQILQAALNAELEVVVTVGRHPDGTLWLSSSTADAYEILWLLETGKKQLLEHDE